jgi:uncharacterized protein YggU (UPF0235/DUF167 family)
MAPMPPVAGAEGGAAPRLRLPPGYFCREEGTSGSFGNFRRGLPCGHCAGRLAGLEVSLADDLPDLSHLARPGAQIAVRVTPNARREGIVAGDVLRISVTVVPEEGRATAAAQALLARALGVAKTRLTLMRGAKARDKLFRLD